MEGLDVDQAVDTDLIDALLVQLDDAQGQALDNAAQSEQPSPLASSNLLPGGEASNDDFAVGETAARLEVLFVDERVDDADQLLIDLRGDDDGSTRWIIVKLAANRDGIEQISETLATLSGVDAIHLASHGNGNGIQLGNTDLTLQSSAGYASDIANWGLSLDVDSDILIYGCDLASTAEGRALVDAIAMLSGADVAASDDATGYEALGGDWVLEYTIGDVTTDVAFGYLTQATWDNVLDLTAAGGETLVNGSTTGNQLTTPYGGGNLSMNASGQYVVAWEDARGGNADSYVKVFNADGTVRTAEFLAHAANASQQDWTNVAMADNGNIVVTWSDNRSGTYESYMRLFDINGTALTGETLISSQAGVDDYHAVDFASDGSYVIVWQNAANSGDIYFQRYNASGVAQGANTRVNSTTADIQNNPDVAVNDDGSYVVTWMSNNQDAAGTYGIYAQRYNASGVAQGANFLVNQTTAGNQQFSTVDSDSAGNFVVTWASSDGNGDGVWARRFNSSGTALGSEFRVNTYTQGNQASAHVDMNAAGDFIVAWSSASQDGSGNGIYSQQFDSAGTRIGGEVLVNTTTTNEQIDATVAFSGSSAVIAWSGNGAQSGQVDSYGVYTKRFTTTNYSTLTVNTTSNTADGTTTSIAALLNNKGADGVISLREAILATNNSANGTGGADRIFFNIGTGAQTITVSGTDLQEFLNPVILDATTQSGYSGAPLISIVDGDTRTYGLKLWTGSDGSTIRGFNVQGFTTGIDITSSGNTIAGNYVGTNAAGTAAAGNGTGINIWQGDNNIIGGTGANDRNVISGNTGVGLAINTTADSTQVLGNYIGLNAAGTAAVANTFQGIYIADSIGTLIGGTTTASRNVISGNGTQGIYMTNADNSVIYGNYIGTNAAGTADINGTTANSTRSGIVMLNGSSGNQIGNTIAGARNVISGNNHYGVEIQGATSQNNTVSGNYIGTDSTGLVALGNTNGGFSFWGSGTGNSLVANVVSGNLGYGVLVGNGSSSAVIQGNYIGLGVDGSTVVGNTSHGILVDGATNTLIGTNADGSNDTAEANTISGNDNGIVLNVSGVGTTGTMIYGNFIGTDASGLLDRGNTLDGVRIQNGATGNFIGGAGTARRNIIAGNNQDGIQIDGETTDGNFIQNNWIGLAADGVTVLGNGGDGIYISGGADNTVIGGIGLGNVIMGARVAGIEIDGASTGTSILGNLIGINAAGTVIHGSGEHGILLENGAASTTIGGTTAGQGNTIVDSGRLSATWQSGIALTSTAGSSNSIIGNSIYNNRGLGIDLGATGVTANDNLDPDSGANTLQNTPVLTTATTNGSTVTVSGTLNTLASTAGVLIHFYATPSTGSITTRQGRRYLGSTTVGTNASGDATFTNVALSAAVTTGELITATTTRSSNTSEFSQAVVATASTGNSAPSDIVATSTTTGGVTINSGSGNSTYLEAANGSSILGGLSQFSMEFDFQAEAIVDGRQYSFTSYTTATDGDAMYFGASKSGASESIVLQINGQVAAITTADVDAIFDGNRHSIAATWSQTSGAWAIYFDGALLGSGTGLATGQSLASSGNLVIGQDMDAGTDTWQVTPGGVFKGTLYDVRFFNDVRTASEVAANYRSTLPFNESGMVANWRMNDLSTSGVITGSVSGNDLTVRQMTTPSFTASTPTLSLAVNENSSAGTIVGSVYGTDLDREARIATLLAADSSLRYSAETGKFYKLSSSTADWLTANSTASSTTLNGANGQLVTIRSAAENAIVWDMIKTPNVNAWIGASDQTVEGEWSWYSSGSQQDQFWSGAIAGSGVDGKYTNWHATQPNDLGGNEDAARINPTDGRWYDAQISGFNQNYIIEWNADDVLDATNALTYSIQSQTVAGAFTIDTSTGTIIVADGSLLDYETNATHSLTVRVSDGTSTYDEGFTVSLSDLAESNNAPTNLSSGIELNLDGGNDAYLITSNGNAVLGGLSGFTTEFRFSLADDANTSVLMSYRSPSDSGANDDAFRLAIGSGGDVVAMVNGVSFSTTGYDYHQLADGSIHALGFSWDSTTGAWAVYVDGELTSYGTAAATSGMTIRSGGTLVFAHEQDSIDGGYDTTNLFEGTLYDIRIWNEVRSEAEISLNYQNKFDSGSLPSGLVANWQMDGFNGSNQVVDVVSGNNLSIGHATGAGFIASTPVEDLHISENAVGGTSVGFVVPSDPDVSNDIVRD